jgi:hypothetical protein
VPSFKRPPTPPQRPLRGRHGTGPRLPGVLGPPPPKPPPAPPGGPPGDDPHFHRGDPERQDWDPDRWVYQKTPRRRFEVDLILVIGLHIKGPSIRIAFLIHTKGGPPGGKRYQETAKNVWWLGARVDKDGFLSALRTSKLATIVEDMRGWAPGTVLDVLEVSIAEAWPPGS